MRIRFGIYQEDIFLWLGVDNFYKVNLFFFTESFPFHLHFGMLNMIYLHKDDN